MEQEPEEVVFEVIPSRGILLEGIAPLYQDFSFLFLVAACGGLVATAIILPIFESEAIAGIPVFLLFAAAAGNGIRERLQDRHTSLVLESDFFFHITYDSRKKYKYSSISTYSIDVTMILWYGIIPVGTYTFISLTIEKKNVYLEFMFPHIWGNVLATQILIEKLARFSKQKYPS